MWRKTSYVSLTHECIVHSLISSFELYMFRGQWYLPVSHLSPLNPGGQLHAHLSMPSRHVPPFRQGSDAHSLKSGGIKEYIWILRKGKAPNTVQASDGEAAKIVNTVHGILKVYLNITLYPKKASEQMKLFFESFFQPIDLTHFNINKRLIKP